MRATALLDLVRRLLEHEAAESQDQDSLIEATERVTDKLRLHLSSRIGQEGFRTLLARALTLTTAQFPHLSAVRIGADTALIGLRRAGGTISQEKQHNQEEHSRVPQGNLPSGAVAVDGAVSIVAHLFGLLVTFIGEELTLRLICTVWPELALSEFALENGAGGGIERP